MPKIFNSPKLDGKGHLCLYPNVTGYIHPEDIFILFGPLAFPVVFPAFQLPTTS